MIFFRLAELRIMATTVADIMKIMNGMADPALAEESGQKLALCATQYPIKEDIFFQDLQVGHNYQVGGCIQENTTIRSRN